MSKSYPIGTLLTVVTNRHDVVKSFNAVALSKGVIQENATTGERVYKWDELEAARIRS